LDIATVRSHPQLDYTSQIHSGQAVKTTAIHNLHRFYFIKTIVNTSIINK